MSVNVERRCCCGAKWTGCALAVSLTLAGFWVYSVFASGSAQARPKTAHGFSYQNERIESVPWSIHIGKLDRSNKDFELHTVLAKNTVVGLNALSEQVKNFPLDFGRPVAAINGDFYRIENSPYQGDPKGLQIMQGELLSAPCDWSCFWIDADGNPHMTNVLSTFNATLPGGMNIPVGLNEERTNNAAVIYTPRFGPSTLTEGGRELILERDGENPWLPLQVGETYTARVREVHETGNSTLSADTVVLSVHPQIAARAPALKPGATITLSTSTLPNLKGCKTAIGGGPALVRGGKAQQWQATQRREPRTAIGWNSSFIYLIEVDGRQRGLSVGMTFPELADYMVKLGCDEALNLDGGGSATFWLYGRVVSSPSEGHERTTANGLVVVRKPKPAPPAQAPD